MSARDFKDRVVRLRAAAGTDRKLLTLIARAADLAQDGDMYSATAALDTVEAVLYPAEPATIPVPKDGKRGLPGRRGPTGPTGPTGPSPKSGDCTCCPIHGGPA